MKTVIVIRYIRNIRLTGVLNISLDSQVHIYSVDTGAFFTKKEAQMHRKICIIKKEKRHLLKRMDKLQLELKQKIQIDPLVDSAQLLRDYRKTQSKKSNLLDSGYHKPEQTELQSLLKSIVQLEEVLQFKTNAIKNAKQKLLKRLADAVAANQRSPLKTVRKINTDTIPESNIISVFESSLTRLLQMQRDDLTDDIMVVKVYYFDVIKDLIHNGFTYGGEKYRFFTASAGQIRTKKTVFIKESLWQQYEKSLMCGLTLDIINQKGGININKYLAYLALSNSSTDLWDNFDIDKTIVVDDFETTVQGLVDYIDRDTFEIERKSMGVPITHTDGCGMMLPEVSKKNFMVRLPWVKGLLGVFDFRRFIHMLDEKNPMTKHGVVKDIYGKEHDILAEDIQIIFTKSQFKMAKYYSDWEEYKALYKKHNCQAGYCNVEEDRIKNAKINYQMIQTLTDMSDSELLEITRTSRNKLENLSSTVESMQEAFGATAYNSNKTPLQHALIIYPELLTDVYCREVLKAIKKSMVKDYKSAKLNVNGKYTFLLPDLYAFCEWLFGGIENPMGLLEDKQVFCRLYSQYDKVDCLRAPHLSKEHAVRNNVIDDKKNDWFITDAVYTSCHDLISKVLQFDVDGDRSLVVADKTLVAIAERNCKDVVPLYYEMSKADPAILSGESIYGGLNAAYVGGNIGAISNDITKIWNSGKVDETAEKCVKWLCMLNNFVID